MIYQLICHPATPAQGVDEVTVQLDRKDTHVSAIFMLQGDLSGLILPPSAKPLRTDHLWQTTCFELFVRTGDEGYVEFNYSPSREWAAYTFTGYRSGMQPLAVDAMPLLRSPPSIWTEDEADGLNCFALGTVTGAIAGEPLIALSAVIEETDGTKSYWALAHPPEGPPDFHHPACFAATLPPPARP